MAGPTAGRQNPLRRCRSSAQNRDETFSERTKSSDSLPEQKDEVEDEKRCLRRNVPEGPSDSDHSEYEAVDSEESEREEEVDSSGFEEDEIKPVRPKRPVKPRNTDQRKRAKLKRAESRSLTRDADRIGLSAKQTEILNDIFSELDPHKNGRITLSDILRVADDHGLGYGPEEVGDMVRFWDTSGTVTISYETFMRLAIEAKFMAPSAI